MNGGKITKPPRLEYLRVANFRALRDVEFKGITPLTVFIGPNGSGKSTVFDVFAFLSECFTEGLRRAWDRRGRFKELRSRGSDGPIVIELRFREPGQPLVTYQLEIEEKAKSPVVHMEMLRWKRQSYGAPFRFLEFKEGSGFAVTGDAPDEKAERDETTLTSPELLAVNTLGQFEKHPRVGALREFITNWHLSYLSAQDTRGTPEAGPQEHLSKTGGNLANVIQFWREQHPELLRKIVSTLVRRVPRLEAVDAEIMADGRLLLQIKDAPFDQPVLARFASDGTLKLLSYLVLMNDPDPRRLIGMEEPENFLHPKLLFELAEECNLAAGRTQLMVTTHSPHFLDALDLNQVWSLDRASDGYTDATKISDVRGMPDFMENGGTLGDLWMEGHFGLVDR